jgi:DNA anti-recombination protein RmuC
MRLDPGQHAKLMEDVVKIMKEHAQPNPPPTESNRQWIFNVAAIVSPFLSMLIAVLTIVGFMNSQINTVNARIDGVIARMDDRFAQVDDRFAQVDAKFDAMGKRMDEMNRNLIAVLMQHAERITAVETKLNTHRGQ